MSVSVDHTCTRKGGEDVNGFIFSHLARDRKSLKGVSHDHVERMKASSRCETESDELHSL